MVNRLLTVLFSTDTGLGELGSVIFIIVKTPEFEEVYTPAYMESPIWNVFICIGFTIELKPFTPFSITPNGDTIRFGIISNDDVPGGIF